jgi:soluble lytic murein transglycosylase
MIKTGKYFAIGRLRSLLFLIVCGLLNSAVFSQSPAEIAQKIKKDVEDKNYSEAISTLTLMQNGDGKLFRLNNYDYLLARLSEMSGDNAGAAGAYQAVVKRNSVLSEYALWHLSELMADGNRLLERLYLKQIVIFDSDSLLAESAQMRLAESYYESRDFPSAIAVLQKARFFPGNNIALLPGPAADPITGALAGSDPRTRGALVLMGQAYVQNGQAQQARDVFNRLANELSDPAMPDDFALAAARGLDELDGSGQNSGTPAEISEQDHIKRAAIYQFNRDFAAARRHYNAVIEHFPQSAFVPEAMFQIGRGLTQEGLYDDALPWFERLQAEFPAHPMTADALNLAASTYARTKKTNEAVSRYQKYIATYPEGDSFERAFLNIIDAWRDDKEFIRALEWTEKTQERFNGKATGALAIFARAKIYIAENDWDRARSTLDELQQQGDLGGARIPGGTTKEEVAFLRAFTLEQAGRSREAIEEYLQIPDGRNEYYGWRATERLKALAKDAGGALPVADKLAELKAAANRAAEQSQWEPARKAAQAALRLTDEGNAISDLQNIVRRAYAALPEYAVILPGKAYNVGRQEIVKERRRDISEQDPHLAIADELLFLGLYDEGAPELEIALRENGASPKTDGSTASPPRLPEDTAYTLALLYLKGGLPNRAEAYVEAAWKKVPDDYLCELAPREMMEMLYPKPFAASLITESRARDLDPRFTLSIMRQESRFRAEVKSNAAARGLMQFISVTSDKIAAELGRTDFRQDELYSPPVAILFGSQYLKDLFDQFAGQPQAVAASYNAGETNVARWIKRSHSKDPDRYVPELSFSQSKDYVYKVMANYRIYCLLYDKDLNSLTSIKPQ